MAVDALLDHGDQWQSLEKLLLPAPPPVDNGGGGCADVVSYCQSGGVAPYMPSVPDTESLANYNLNCAYLEGYSSAAGVTDPKGCRKEVEPAGVNPLMVQFSCSSR